MTRPTRLIPVHLPEQAAESAHVPASFRRSVPAAIAGAVCIGVLGWAMFAGTGVQSASALEIAPGGGGSWDGGGGGYDFGGSDFGGSDFGGSDFGGGDFGGSDFGGSDFGGSDFGRDDLGNSGYGAGSGDSDTSRSDGTFTAYLDWGATLRGPIGSGPSDPAVEDNFGDDADSAGGSGGSFADGAGYDFGGTTLSGDGVLEGDSFSDGATSADGRRAVVTASEITFYLAGDEPSYSAEGDAPSISDARDPNGLDGWSGTTEGPQVSLADSFTMPNGAKAEVVLFGQGVRLYIGADGLSYAVIDAYGVGANAGVSTAGALPPSGTTWEARAAIEAGFFRGNITVVAGPDSPTVNNIGINLNAGGFRVGLGGDGQSLATPSIGYSPTFGFGASYWAGEVETHSITWGELFPNAPSLSSVIDADAPNPSGLDGWSGEYLGPIGEPTADPAGAPADAAGAPADPAGAPADAAGSAVSVAPSLEAGSTPIFDSMVAPAVEPIVTYAGGEFSDAGGDAASFSALSGVDFSDGGGNDLGGALFGDPYTNGGGE